MSGWDGVREERVSGRKGIIEGYVSESNDLRGQCVTGERCHRSRVT